MGNVMRLSTIFISLPNWSQFRVKSYDKVCEMFGTVCTSQESHFLKIHGKKFLGQCVYLTRITFLPNPWQNVFWDSVYCITHKNHISLKSMAKRCFGTMWIPHKNHISIKSMAKRFLGQCVPHKNHISLKSMAKRFFYSSSKVNLI